MPGERLLLLAQSPVLRTGIQGIVAGSLPIERVVEASNALEAAVLVTESDPTLVIIQDSLPGVTGFVAVKMLRELQPSAKILILSDRLRDEDITRAFQQGANALVPAAIDPANFVERVRDVLAGPHPVNDQVLSPAATPSNESWSSDFNNLSAHEIAILDGVVRGLSSQDIAESLVEQEQRVKSATASLIHKLGASDLTTAIVSAVRLGIVDLRGHLPVHESMPEFTMASPA